MWQPAASARFCEATHHDRPAIHALTGDRLIERAVEGIIAQHADHDRRALVGEGSAGPVDELREIEEEDGLDLLRRRRGERGPAPEQARDGERRRGSSRRTGSQKPHLSRPKTLRSMALRS